ncbi:hypothetical protein Dimus_018886, partial [Dionaea muscipula]
MATVAVGVCSRRRARAVGVLVQSVGAIGGGSRHARAVVGVLVRWCVGVLVRWCVGVQSSACLMMVEDGHGDEQQRQIA